MTALALPSGRPRTPRALTLTTLLAGSAVSAGLAAVIAAYIQVRALTDGKAWPPEDVRLDPYLGSMLAITMLMSSSFVEWGSRALRAGQRRQLLGAFSLAAFFGLAYLNGLWYLATERFGFAVASSPYATLVYALLIVVAAAAAAGVAALLAAMAKVGGRQQSGHDDDTVRAVAWWWHLTVVWSVAVYATVFLFK